MTNTNDMRSAFQDFRDQRNKELAANGLDDQSNFWITNAHYTAWCRGIEWLSQQAQGEPVAFARMLGGEVDWDENCLFPDAETGISDLDGRGDSDEYEIVPLYRHPPVLANMPEQGEHTKPVADAVKHLNDWLSMGLCGCEGPGHSCGATQIRNTIEALEKLLNAPPAPAAVPEFDKKLFDSECRESVAGALGFPRGGDYAWSYLLAQIKEVVEAAGRLPASPAPAAVPDEAFNLIEAIRAELTWPGWRKTSSRDWVMDMVSELLSMLTASPAPEHAADVCKMVAPDVSELEKAAQKLWRESYNCESDFIQAVVDAFSKQEEEENDRNN